MTDTGVVRQRDQGRTENGKASDATRATSTEHGLRSRNGVGLTTKQEFRPSAPQAPDIDWQLRYGETETPEVTRFLGYDLPDDLD